MIKPVVSGLLTGMAMAALLTGCNPAEKAARDHSGAQPAYAESKTTDGAAVDVPDRPDPRSQPIPKVDGKPMWSANKRRTAEENAQAAFERNGETFGAKDVDAFVAKAHAFVSDPPAGVQKITRANGDVELYDAKSNTFAVVTKDGAPSTMFKPDTGAAYWESELAKAKGAEKTASRKSSRKRDDNEG